MEKSTDEDRAALYTSSFWSSVCGLSDKVVGAETVFWGNAVTCFPDYCTLAWNLASACI